MGSREYYYVNSDTAARTCGRRRYRKEADANDRCDKANADREHGASDWIVIRCVEVAPWL